MEATRMYPLRSNNVLRLRLSLCQRHHQVCLLGRLLRKLDTEVLRAFYHLASTLLSSRTFLHLAPHHLRALHRLDSAHLQEVLHRGCSPLGSSSLVLEERDDMFTI